MALYTVKKTTTPTEFSNYLNNQGSIFWAEPEQFWVVTDHNLSTAILKSEDFSADRSNFFMKQMSGCPFHKVANFLGVVKKMMVTSDGDEHLERRKLAASGLRDVILDSFQPRAKMVVSELLSKLTSDESVDFVNQVALPLPNIVLADLFSIPADQRPAFYTWANHMTQFFGGGTSDILRDGENADHAAASLTNYFQLLLNQRRGKKDNDFISHMISQQGSLEDSELISQAAIMLVAGTITTTDQICNNLYTLLSTGAWGKLTQDRSLLDNALEEANRLDPAVNFIFRVAKKDLRLGSAEIKAGQLVFISTHAANRNETIFTNPDNFSFSRSRTPHLSFGSGNHYCLGARLGRIQMTELFGQLLEKFPNLHLIQNERPIRKHQSLGFSGFESFNISLESKTQPMNATETYILND